MPNVIEELLANGSVDTAALASQLRRENEYGTVGSLSGSSRLAPMAAAMQKNAMSTAQGIGDSRAKDAQLNEKNTLDAWRAEMTARARSEEGRMNRQNARDIAGARIGSAEKIAKMRQGAGGAPDPVGMANRGDEYLRLSGIAGQAKKESGFWNTGWRSNAASIGGPGADLKNRLLALQSNEALTNLMELRAASKTGASGLGVASDKDIELLMSTHASLSQIQSEEQLDEALTLMETLYAKLGRELQQSARKMQSNGDWRQDLLNSLDEPDDDGTGSPNE